MAGYIAGDAFIRILPDFSGIVTRISAEAQKWGAQAGRDFTDAFNRAARTGNVPIGPSTAQAARQGTSSGGSFAEAFKRRVEASLRSLPDIQVGAATGPAEQKIRDLQARLEALRGSNIGVDIDAGAALSELRALQAELSTISAQSADIKVKADFATAAAQLAAFEADLKRLSGQDATVDVRLSGGFAQRVKAQIAAALQNLPEAVIGANSTQVDAKLTQIRAELGSLRDLEIGVDIDAGSALSRIAAVQVALTDLRASNPTIDVDVDAARAQAELAAIEAEITALGAEDVKIPVDTSSGIAGFQALLGAGILLAPALIPIGAAITAAFAGVAVAIAGIVAAVGVVAFALVPVVKALMAVSAAHKQAGADAAKSAKQQASAAYAIETANRQVAAATEGVAQARENAARSAEDSARRVADAEENSARASEDAARGVADAQRQATEGSARAARAVEDAQTRLADTVEENGQRRQQALDSLATAERAYSREQQQIADDIERAEKSVTDARREAASTAEDAARQVASALKQQQSAERALRDAQAASLKAQNDLNDARQTAARRLEDLQAASQQGTLDERDALLDLKKAQDALAGLGATKSSGDPVRDSVTGEPIAVATPVVSPEDRARAELAVAEAQQRVNDVQRQNTRTTEDLTVAQKKGVDGSDEVVAAQQQVAQTAEQAQLAEADLAQARLDYTRAQRDEITKNTVAQEALNEALARQVELAQSLPDRRTQADQQVRAARENVPAVENDNAERLAKAQRDVSDAQKAQAKAVADGARQIADAQRSQARAVEDGAKSVADAQRAQGVAAEQSAQQVASAQKSLADARRNAAHSIAQSNDDISASSRKADEALAGLSPAGRSFVDFLQNQLAPAFSGFSKAAQEGLLPGLQAGLTALLPVLPKVKGFIGEIAGVLGDMAASAGKALAGPEFAGFFSTLATQLPGIIRLLGSIAGSLTKAFAGLFIGILPLGVSALQSFNGLLERFVNWTNGLDKNNGFQSFLQYAKESLPVVGAFLGNLFQALGKLIQVAAPFGVLVVDVLSALFDLIGKIPPAVLAGIFVAAGIALIAFAGPVLAVIAGITLLGIGLTYLVTHFGEVKDYIANKLGPVFSWLNDAIVQPVTRAIVAAFTGMRDFIVGAVNKVVTFTRDNWQLLLAILTGPIGLAVLAISKNWDSIRGFFSAAWSWVKDTFSTAWDGVTAVITKPVLAAADWIRDTWYPTFKGNINAAWTWARDTFSASWDKVEGILKAPFSAARDAIGAWDGDGRGGVLGALHTRFDAFVKGVGDVWSGLRALTAEPIKFIIDTVLNKGLIGAFNWIAGKLPGGDKLKIDPIAIPGALSAKSKSNPDGYASGGVIAGPYLGPAADNVLIRANPDEYMQPVSAHRYYGTRVMDAIRARAIPADALRRIAGFARGGWIKPVKGPFGEPFDGVTLNGNTGYKGHTGQDFPVPGGTPVVAVANGLVTRSEDIGDRSYGRVVEIDHGGGLSTLYAHMSQLIAQRGQQIAQNALVGLSGNYGNVTGAGGGYHLHFEVKENGHAVNPLPFLQGADDPGDGGRNGGLGGFIRDLAGNIFDPIGAFTDRITAPLDQLKELTGGSFFGKLVAAVPQSLVGAAKDAITGLLPDIGSLGTVPTGGANREIGKRLAAARGWTGTQWNALNQLWTGESGWNERADNPTSSAYGIPQALPGSKMASAGADWLTNPETQIKWGLGYIGQRYGSPELALQEWLGRSPHWYDQGGYLPPGLSMVMNGTGKPEPVFTDAQFSAITAGNSTSSSSERAYHYHAAEGRSMPEDDFLEAGARAEVLFAGW